MTARWFLLPIATDDRGGRYPQHTRRDGVDGFSGNIYDLTPVTDVPDGEFYIARVFGPTEVLDAIESEPESETIASLGLPEAAVADMLNTEFGQQRSFAEWEQRFLAGDV